ncbi:MAG TPA: Uma2 family endonuclease [Gemmatimonadaceae bacterium]|nr:Uma2 family endonuclease [Gemmatimonadaceae bacterium]
MAVPIYWTADMVRALPDDGKQYETVYGELLVSPAPRVWHEVIVDRFSGYLRDYVRLYRLDLHVFGSRSDISWSDDTLVQPDVFVVPLSEARTLQWSAMKSLLLAVEVLSPASLRADRFTKRRLYQDVGIPLYWIVDADAHQVEIWTPEVRFPTVERERVIWAPEGSRKPCAVELEEFFRPL